MSVSAPPPPARGLARARIDPAPSRAPTAWAGLSHAPRFGSDGKRDMVHQLGAGNCRWTSPGGGRTSANITSDPETGIGRWTDDQIAAALTRGVRPDGAILSPIMPWPYWAAMRPEDLKALVAWLRTLKPVAHAVDR